MEQAGPTPTNTSGLGRRAIIGAAWSQLGTALNVGLLFAFNLLVTRALAPQQKGAFDVYVAIMGVAVLLTNLGLNSALVRFAPETNSAADPARRRILFNRFLRDRLLVCGLVGVVVAVFHAAIAQVLNSVLFAEMWPLFVVALVANQAFDIANAAMQANLRMRSWQLLIAARVTMNIALVALLFVVRGPQAQLVVAAMTLSAAIVAAAGLAYVWRVNARGALGELTLPAPRELYRFAIGAWLISLTTFGLSNQSDVLLINWLIADNAQVAYYNTGYLLVSQGLTVLSGWTAVLLPALSAGYVSLGAEGIRRAWMPFVKLQVMMFVPAALLLARLGPSLVVVLFGERYAPAGAVTSAYGLLFLFPLLATSTAYSALFTAGRMRLLIGLHVAAACISIGLDIVLLPLIGILGAVVATMAAQSFSGYIEYFVSRRMFGVGYPVRFVSEIVLAAGVATLSTMWLPIQGGVEVLIVAGAQWLAVMFGLMWLLKPLRAEEIGLLATANARVAGLAARFARP